MDHYYKASTTIETENNKRVIKQTKIYSELYIVNEVGTGFVKVGYSQLPKQRLNDLQVGNPHELKLLYHCKVDNAPEREKEIHRILKDNGKHIRGEWFKIENATLKQIANYMYKVGKAI